MKHTHTIVKNNYIFILYYTVIYNCTYTYDWPFYMLIIYHQFINMINDVWTHWLIFYIYTSLFNATAITVAHLHDLYEQVR